MSEDITVEPDVELSDTLASRVRQRRKELNLTTKELSEAVGVSNQSIYFYEKGERDPTGSNLFALADALSVSARWLVLGVDDGTALPLHIPARLHPVITQSKACLTAYIESGMKSHDLVGAAISILNSTAGLKPA